MKNKTKNKIKKKKNILIGTIIALVLISASLFFLSNDSLNQKGDSTSTGDVVAIVNGEEIISSEVDLVEQYFLQQGQEISRQDIMQELIVQELFLQEAKKEGYEISDEELESIIAGQLEEQNSTLEDYKNQLEMQGISYEEEIKNSKEQLEVQQYLSSEIAEKSLEVTEEEAHQVYEMYSQQSTEDLPSFEEVKSQIILSLEQQKQQEAISQLAQKLLSNADIEYV
ncbi:MAG TPA: SurA N-terminal domain-containing protein [Candidatus Nanoarchaeia archaeon]|nr:SurA N-terminal domain-containing protein [Candidatus Nanoarchaeia archaeon]